MVIAELWMGASSKSDKEDIEDLVSLLHHFPIQEEVWKTANRLAAICRSKGTPVPGSDLVIAACAFFRQAEIESSDRHFDILEKYRPLL
jgi:predicted nucleic acid-binding protein